MRRGRAAGPALRWLALVAVVALACVGTWRAVTPEGRHRVEPVSGAGEQLGAATCLECHVDFGGHRVRSEIHADCESCHGPGQLHVHTAEAEAIRFPGSADCAVCHEPASRTLVHWAASPHAEAGVLCSDCHATHDRQPALLRSSTELDATLWRHAGSDTQLCLGCHADVAGELSLPSHHPVREGMVACADCHPPHGRLGDSPGPPTDTCSGCHQEVMGPWIFEHPPVNEDCATCHRPHGATADSLLDATQPGVCVSCHTLAEAGAVHQPYAFTTDCTDCHGAVHGSYTDPHLRR